MASSDINASQNNDEDSKLTNVQSVQPTASLSDTSPMSVSANLASSTITNCNAYPDTSSNPGAAIVTNNDYPEPVVANTSINPPNTSIPTMPNMPPLGLTLPDMPPPYEESEQPINAGALHHDTSSLGINPPSYEEVQQQKALEAGIEYPMPFSTESNTNRGVQVIHVAPIGGQSGQLENLEEIHLGTDLMFLAAFTGTFVFNWMALIFFLCFCHTIAGRTGALAGFGISSSLIAVFRYPRHTGYTKNAWFIWIVLILGLMISVRAILQYTAAKRKSYQPHQNQASGFSLIC